MVNAKLQYQKPNIFINYAQLLQNEFNLCNISADEYKCNRQQVCIQNIIIFFCLNLLEIDDLLMIFVTINGTYFRAYRYIHTYLVNLYMKYGRGNINSIQKILTLDVAVIKS